MIFRSLSKQRACQVLRRTRHRNILRYDHKMCPRQFSLRTKQSSGKSHKKLYVGLGFLAAYAGYRILFGTDDDDFLDQDDADRVEFIAEIDNWLKHRNKGTHDDWSSKVHRYCIDYTPGSAIFMKEKQFLVILNPGAGKSNGGEYFYDVVKPVLEKLGFCNFRVLETEKFDEDQSVKLLPDEDLLKYDAIICISGDGTLIRLYRELQQRDEHASAGGRIFEIPIGVVPSGSGNHFWRTLDESNPFEVSTRKDAISAALRIANGRTIPLDFIDGEATMVDGTKERMTAPLGPLYGFMCRMIADAEHLRWTHLGMLRYIIAALNLGIRNYTYPFEVRFLPGESGESPPEDLDHWKETDAWKTYSGEFSTLMCWPSYPLPDRRDRAATLSDERIYISGMQGVSRFKMLSGLLTGGLMDPKELEKVVVRDIPLETDGRFVFPVKACRIYPKDLKDDEVWKRGTLTDEGKVGYHEDIVEIKVMFSKIKGRLFR